MIITNANSVSVQFATPRPLAVGKSGSDNSDPSYVPGRRQVARVGSKPIKKRVRNRYGNNTEHLGFTKVYVIKEQTGRANQLFKCLHCPVKMPKLCNMIDHQKTHRQEKTFKCQNCLQGFVQAGNRDRHYYTGACLQSAYTPDVVSLLEASPPITR
jgi:hypothetical protein